MKAIIVIGVVITLSGCAAGQRYSECDKQYPQPPNVSLLRGADATGGAGSYLLGLMMASATGEDKAAYDQWKQDVNACINQKAAAVQ